MAWLAWIGLAAVLIGVFALWDLVLCAGRHCARFEE
jgi:hypothetical protein